MKYPGDPTTAERNYFWQLGLRADESKRMQVLPGGNVVITSQPKTDRLAAEIATTALAPLVTSSGVALQSATVFDADGRSRLVEGVPAEGQGVVEIVDPADRDRILMRMAKLLHDSK